MNGKYWEEVDSLLNEKNPSSTLEDIYDYFDDIYTGHISDDLVRHVEYVVSKWPQNRRKMSYDIPPSHLEWIWNLAAPLDVHVYSDIYYEIHQLSKAVYTKNVWWLSISYDYHRLALDEHQHLLRESLPLFELGQELHSLEHLCLDVHSDGEQPGPGWTILSELLKGLSPQAPLQSITATGVRLSEGQLPKLLEQLDQRERRVIDLRLCTTNLKDEDLYTLAQWKNAKNLENLWLFGGGAAYIYNPSNTYHDVTLDDYGWMKNQFSKEGVTAFCRSPYLPSAITANWRSLLDS